MLEPVLSLTHSGSIVGNRRFTLCWTSCIMDYFMDIIYSRFRNPYHLNFCLFSTFVLIKIPNRMFSYRSFPTKDTYSSLDMLHFSSSSFSPCFDFSVCIQLLRNSFCDLDSSLWQVSEYVNNSLHRESVFKCLDEEPPRINSPDRLLFEIVVCSRVFTIFTIWKRGSNGGDDCI